MCTVIISWNPPKPALGGVATAFPLVVGANRDERIDRPSTHFDVREDGAALYPLDVGGGTWIGANDRGLFAAITDRDDVESVPGRESRGMLVRRALGCGSVAAVASWADELVSRRYNGFRLIAADRRSLMVWEADGRSESVVKITLPSGLHVVSGFGVDTWDVPRCAHVRRSVGAGTGPADMRRILASHLTGLVDSDVCVHDPGETHVTVSSCVIVADRDWGFAVDAVRTAPCLGTEWDSWTISPPEQRGRPPRLP